MRTVRPQRQSPWKRAAVVLGLLGLFGPGRLAWGQWQPLFPGGAFGPQVDPDESGASGELDLSGSIAPFVDGDVARRFEVLRGEVDAKRFDIAVEAKGNILVADSEAFGGTGGIIRIDPKTGEQSKVAAGGKVLGPRSVAVVRPAA